MSSSAPTKEEGEGEGANINTNNKRPAPPPPAEEEDVKEEQKSAENNYDTPASTSTGGGRVLRHQHKKPRTNDSDNDDDEKEASSLPKPPPPPRDPIETPLEEEVESEEEEEEEDDASDYDDVVVDWPSAAAGTVSRTSQEEQKYKSVKIWTVVGNRKKKPFTVRVGDDVYLATADFGPMLGRVEQLIRTDNDSDSGQVVCRWFMARKHVLQKMKKTNIISGKWFVNRMRSDEVVMTNLRDTNDVRSIMTTTDNANNKKKNIHYVYHGKQAPRFLKNGVKLCRCTIDIDIDEKTLVYGNLVDRNSGGEVDDDDDYGAATPGTQNDEDDDTAAAGARDDENTLSSGGGGRNDSDDDDSSSSDDASSVEQSKMATIQEGEGTTLRGDIQVGSKYQINVKPFDPNQKYIPSRKQQPKRIYTPGCISDEQLQVFLNKVAEIQNPYLIRENMTNEEPYSPLPHDRVEELMLEAAEDNTRPPLTGSFLSTASMLATGSNNDNENNNKNKKANLLKECDSDALLELLADCQYDTDRALQRIQSYPLRISNGWTGPEKSIYDDCFRRHQGSLRNIAKVIAPTKDMKDVIDYHFRCKIPDQFRRYQNKKREHAVRMVECMETRKYYNHDAATATITDNGNNNNDEAGVTTRQQHWSETSVSNVTDARDERVRKAKQLLLDVKTTFGKETMQQVAGAIRQLQVSYDPETRKALFNLLGDQKEMQKRFLEFLPKHF